ncbi:hypothetical protein N5C93_22090, partial [Pseudomonas nitroreducens]|uniref:hypothetical protein n=2 Tax=Pseudomonas nitroreducens TaxID=46680 RepID=UPI00244BEED0
LLMGLIMRLGGVYETRGDSTIIIKNYSTILNSVEIDDITQPIYESIERQAEHRISRYFTLWTLSIILFITIFSAGTIYQSLKTTPKSDSKNIEQSSEDRNGGGAHDLNHPSLLETTDVLHSI